jgi:DNA-binding NtrC family response regulator
MSPEDQLPTVLLIDDETEFAQELSERLAGRCRILWAENLAQASHRLAQREIDIILLDLVLNQESGFAFLKHHQRSGGDLPVIVISKEARPEWIEEAVRLGAAGFIHKRFTDDDFGIAMHHALALARRRSRLRRAGAEMEIGGDPFVAEAPASRALLREIERIARTKAPVLLLGETGTGKTRIASEIHQRSGRGGQFVIFHPGDVPETLIEDALFGHERGAFATATALRLGCIEHA